MTRRSGSGLNFLLTLGIVLVLVLAGSAWLLNRYPWPVFLSDFSLARMSTFVGHWPIPAIEEDRQERKKLKRFPRSEQQRRLSLIMRRMDYLTVPIFDFFMDPGVQYIAPELPAGVISSSPLIWPALPTRRRMGTEETQFKDIRYVVVPTSSGVQCLEGVSLSAGEELRVNLPVARNKRNIVFTVVPLAPSNLRAWLGQFSWARQFTDADVNRPQFVSVPVNDPAASMLRLSLGTGNVILTSASISQWDRSGRVPVQLGAQSALWRSANETVSGAEENSSAMVEQASEESVTAQTASTDEVLGSTGSSNTSAVAVNENSTTAAQSPGTAANSAPRTDAASSQMTVAKSSEAVKAKETKNKSSSTTDDLLDPASVKFNQVIPVNGTRSVAIGYNLLLMQMDPIFSAVLDNEKLLAALAPNLHAFLSHSLSLSVNLPNFKHGSDLFQHSIVRERGQFIPVELPILTRDLVSKPGVFNLYQEFRNFGYKVVSFAPPHALSLPGELSLGSEIPSIAGRWLDNNDWRFVARRKELDQQNEPASGLEAIFKSERDSQVAAINDSDFDKMSRLLAGLESQHDAIPDWRANEISVISSKSHYLPRLVDSFQRWTKENFQSRFFAHVYLQNDDLTVSPSFKDFIQVFKHKKFGALTSPGQTETYARIVMLDRTFGWMLDNLVARRTYHRTVVSVLLPRTPKDKASQDKIGQFHVAIPGLAGRKLTGAKQRTLDDALSTMAQTVGIQLPQNDNESRILFRGVSLEEQAAPQYGEKQKKPSTVVNALESDLGAEKEGDAESEETLAVANTPASSQAMAQRTPAEVNDEPKQVSRFRMIVLPRAAGCQSFEWTTSSQYFGLRSSQPIIEEPAPRGRVIRVFPCSLRDQVIELSWYQAHDAPASSGVNASQVSNWLGGTLNFNLSPGSAEPHDAPFFLVGPQALSLDSLPMRLESFLPEEIPHLFDLDTKRAVERETLARLLNLNSQMQSAELSARTLVYFFREPVRR